MRGIPASCLPVLGLGLGLIVGLGGCPNKRVYPACGGDEHCEPGERCVDALCQNCKVDADCQGKGPQGEDLSCVEFRCTAARPGQGSCQHAGHCDPGLRCAAGSCEPCTAAGQCDSGVCSESGRCQAPPCQTDDDCPIDEICDGGQCLYHALDGDGEHQDPNQGAVCGVAPLYFGFDSAKLSPNNQEQLKQAVPCLIETLAGGGTLVLEAHADKVGRGEHKAALAERRGATVSSFLIMMGVPEDEIRVVSKGADEATGTDERTRARDRRVVLTVE